MFMQKDAHFNLQDFLPYLLNQAAERSSLEFQRYYKLRYGMLRTEWRVLFHLGRYGRMTAKDICDRASVHKTKVSRAVAALTQKRFVARDQLERDRRHEELSLTNTGRAAFEDLVVSAQKFDADLMAQFTAQEAAILRRCLKAIAQMDATSSPS